MGCFKICHEFCFSGSIILTMLMFCLRHLLSKIGTLQNFQVSPVPDQTWKFYDEQGQEITDTTDYSIQCTTTTCQNSCQRPDTDAVAESSLDGSGDVWIGGNSPS